MAQSASASACAAAARRRSRSTRRIDISRVGAVREAQEPLDHLLGREFTRMDVGEAFAKKKFERLISDRRAAIDAGAGDVALDRRKFERQRLDRGGEAGERLGLVALDIDLDETRDAVARDQRVERRHRHLDARRPMLAFPAGRAARRRDEGLRGGRDGRIGEIKLEGDRALPSPDRARNDRHRVVAAVDEAQRSRQGRLRLDRDDPRAESAERSDAVADMAADIEHEIAACDEAPVMAIERRAPRTIAIIDAQRPQHAPRRADGVKHHGSSGRVSGVPASPSPAGGGSDRRKRSGVRLTDPFAKTARLSPPPAFSLASPVGGRGKGEDDLPPPGGGEPRLLRAVFVNAGSASASRGDGSISSGSRPMPARSSAAPTAGLAVITQSGTAKASPPAMRSETGIAAGAATASAPRQAHPRTVCGQSFASASASGTAWSSRAWPPQPTLPPNTSVARNTVCANHMIGDSIRKKIVSKRTLTRNHRPPP